MHKSLSFSYFQAIINVKQLCSSLYSISNTGKQVTKRLTEITKDDPAILLKEHILELFGDDFEMEQYHEIMMEGNTEDDTPGFMIVLGRTTTTD
ncbi:MAG: hypothetical protein ABFS05_00240 [Bacteroidota bacterium]